MSIHHLKVIGFDADDTLWVNEPYFRQAEEKFCSLLEDYLPHHSIQRELLKIEISNLPLYGYGIKAFMLSMVETAIAVSDKTLAVDIFDKIIAIGKEQLDHPIELLDGVEKVLMKLQKKYRLVVVTKGDLLDQERKLNKSGLASYFHHIEIVSEKRASDYHKLLSHLDIKADEFMMVGNSLKSDILPILELGGYGTHVPYHITWEHEKIDTTISDPKFHQVEKIIEILNFV